jgi:penicillin-binding protein 1A
LPIVGEFLTKVYDDPSLGMSREARFARPEGWEPYDCPKAIAPDSLATQQVVDDEFFN